MSVPQYQQQLHRLLLPHLLAAAAQTNATAEQSAADTVLPEGAVVESHRAPLAGLLGSELAADLVAVLPLPFFDNSQMDGYAVRVVDLQATLAHQSSCVLPVNQTVAAGRAPAPLEAGSCAAIMTGAAIPAGADAIVAVEQTQPASFVAGIPETAEFFQVPATGAFIRRAGSDAAQGTVLLEAGRRLSPRDLGVCAALGLGVDSVPVKANDKPALTEGGRPRVLIISTGDELLEPGALPVGVQPAPGMIYDANTTMLAALFIEYGCDAVVARPAADDPDSFLSELAQLVRTLQPAMVLSSGGVSEGAYEVVKQALTEHGLQFCKVAMQPGGPQGYGLLRLPGGYTLPMVALPGNPVSSWISVEALIRPVLVSARLRVRDGELLSPRDEFEGVLRLDAPTESSPAKLWQLRRAEVSPGGDVRLMAGPSSHLLAALARANAIVPVPVGVTQLCDGQAVTGWLLENG